MRGAVANHNPRVARITLDGAVLAAGAATRVTAGRAGALRVEFEADAREGYDEPQPDGSARATRETLLTQYLTDAGAIEGAFRSDDEGTAGPHDNRYTAPASGGARLWVVLSDGRGGFDVAERALAVGP